MFVCLCVWYGMVWGEGIVVREVPELPWDSKNRNVPPSDCFGVRVAYVSENLCLTRSHPFQGTLFYFYFTINANFWQWLPVAWIGSSGFSESPSSIHSPSLVFFLPYNLHSALQCMVYYHNMELQINLNYNYKINLNKILK